MHAPAGFAELLPLLLIVIAAVAIMLRLRLPAVLGYIVVGIATGPSALALVGNLETIRSVAELGVVLLLFTIGLEISLPALARMRGALLGLGGAEVLIAAAVTFAVAHALDIDPAGAIVLGGVVAMSSTALVTKQLTDQNELDRPHGRSALGVLLFQDLAVVPFLVVVAGLAYPADAGIAGALGIAFVKGTLVVVALVLAGRHLLRPALSGVAALQSHELFTLTALALALGSAWATAALGLSPALGAFIAGIVLGESPFRHSIEAEIRPFRDLLLALFFVSIGMLVDLAILPGAWPWVLLLFAALVLFKFVLVLGLCRLARMPAATGMRTAIVLAHGGEFGFALLTIALDGDMLPADYGQVVLAALLLSMAVAPLALRFNGALASRLVRPPSPSEVPAPPAAGTGSGDVLLVGFGRVGQQVARLLDDTGIGWSAIDPDPVRVRNAHASGAPVSHGDGSRLDVLRAAGLERARVLVLTPRDADTALRILQQVRLAAPALPILVRAPDDNRLEELRAAGATEVVPETLEASLMVSSQLLFLLGVPTRDVMDRIRAIRHDRYAALRALFPGTDGADPVHPQLRAVHLPPDANGRRLDGLGFEHVGVRVVSLTSAGHRIDAPSPGTALQAGDTLVLSGTPEALDRAEAGLLRR